MDTIQSVQGVPIRLTDERWAHKSIQSLPDCGWMCWRLLRPQREYWLVEQVSNWRSRHSKNDYVGNKLPTLQSSVDSFPEIALSMLHRWEELLPKPKNVIYQL